MKVKYQSTKAIQKVDKKNDILSKGLTTKLNKK